jgi:hypothetical protein
MRETRRFRLVLLLRGDLASELLVNVRASILLHLHAMLDDRSGGVLGWLDMLEVLAPVGVLDLSEDGGALVLVNDSGGCKSKE